MKAGKLLSTILDIGKGMIANGANTWQVEEALLGILDTYCFIENDLLVMSNCIYATVHTCDNRTYTEVKRIRGSGHDLDKLNRLFSLARDVCEKPLGMDTLKERVDEILKSPGNTIWRSLLGDTLAAASFTLFFNGDIIDAIWAALIISLVTIIYRSALNRQKNKLTPAATAAFVMETLIILVIWLKLCHNPDSITLGGTMLLISSLGITNGFRDFLHGDALSGLMDTVNAIIGALGIAVGIMIALVFFAGTEPVALEITPLAASPVLQTVFITAACASFAVSFGARGRSIVFAAAGGGITWIIYLLVYEATGGSLLRATFAGAIFAAAYSYYICRKTHIPETVFLTVCVIALLPGSNLYYVALGAVSNSKDVFFSQGGQLLTICIGISVGLVFVDTAIVYLGMFQKSIRKKIRKEKE